MLRIACDVHTHTLYSRHAYSTIEENVRAAREASLELLGSTDHFSRMVYAPRGTAGDERFDVRDYQYFLNYLCWPRTWREVSLVRGCEADIVDLDGHLFGWDVSVPEAINGYVYDKPQNLKERVFRESDYVIASVHDESICDGASVEHATQMYLNALKDPKVLILGHVIRSGVNFELDPVLDAVRESGKLVEINESTLTDYPELVPAVKDLARRCAQKGVMVSTGSDSHISATIGCFERTRALLEEVDFPQELVATSSAETFLKAMRRAIA